MNVRERATNRKAARNLRQFWRNPKHAECVCMSKCCLHVECPRSIFLFLPTQAPTYRHIRHVHTYPLTTRGGNPRLFRTAQRRRFNTPPTLRGARDASPKCRNSPAPNFCRSVGPFHPRGGNSVCNVRSGLPTFGCVREPFGSRASLHSKRGFCPCVT